MNMHDDNEPTIIGYDDDGYPIYSDEENEKSKSQIKREMKEITDFGMSLAEVSMTVLKKLNLPEDIIAAYEKLPSIRGNEGKKRHFKFIGKKLREVELEPIQQAYNRFKMGLPITEPTSKEPTQSDIWFEKLINNNENPENFIEAFPSCDRQQLRQKVRAALKNEKERSKLKVFINQFC